MKIKKWCVITCMVLILTGCGNSEGRVEDNLVIKTISSDEVYQIINKEEEYYLIDVRSLPEYKSGHLETAINIPLDSISSISNQISSKDVKIIVYCQSGNRSKQAANKLIELGYSSVFDMGGINDWDYEIVE